MAGFETPKHFPDTQHFSELQFTFDYSRQTIIEQNEIIAGTLDTVQRANSEELPIGIIKRKNNIGSTTLNHRITFDKPVLNPGLQVENGIACGFPQTRSSGPDSKSILSSTKHTDHLIEIGAQIFTASMVGTLGYGAYTVSTRFDSSLVSAPLIAVSAVSTAIIILNLCFIGNEVKKMFSESRTLRG